MERIDKKEVVRNGKKLYLYLQFEAQEYFVFIVNQLQASSYNGNFASGCGIKRRFVQNLLAGLQRTLGTYKPVGANIFRFGQQGMPLLDIEIHLFASSAYILVGSELDRDIVGLVDVHDTRVLLTWLNIDEVNPGAVLSTVLNLGMR